LRSGAGAERSEAPEARASADRRECGLPVAGSERMVFHRIQTHLVIEHPSWFSVTLSSTSLSRTEVTLGKAYLSKGIFLNSSGIEHHMNPEATVRDLLYPTEWVFRFFIGAMLVYIASPQWTYASPYLADSFIFPLGYYLLFIGAALWFAVQIWVLMKYVSSRRDNAPLHQ